MSDLVVRPVRFTDNVDGMRAFLITLGLQPRVESVAGGWVDMVAGGGESAGGGMVALHSAKDAVRQAASGFTSLSFEADDIDVLAKRLEAAGVMFAGGAHGVVGLHPPTDKAGPHLAEAGAVRLSFETSEPLDSVATRLTDDGFAPSLRQEAFGAVLAVADADGIAVEVFAT